MLKERRMVAEQIASALFEAEAAIDAALSKTAQLTGIMPALREKAGLSALVGQEALERASQTIAALAEARRNIVETHKELSVAQEQVGLGAVRMDFPFSPFKPDAAHGSVDRNRGRALRPVEAA
jgi:hypothetical protein